MMLLFLDLNTVACTKRICLQYMTRAHKHCPFHYVVLLHIQAKKKMWMMNKLPSKIHHSTMRGFDSSDKQATATHTMTQTGMEGFRDIISGHHFCHKKWLIPMYSKKIHFTVYFWKAWASHMPNEALYNDFIYKFPMRNHSYKNYISWRWSILKIFNFSAEYYAT